jgi:hypothetical protein
VNQIENLIWHQSVMENDIRLAEQPGRAQGEEVRCARPGADEMDDASHVGFLH